ncbi:MAG: ABC transporter permease [Acidobacteriota bacterium]
MTASLFKGQHEAVKALFGFTVRQVLFSVKGLVFLLLALIPWAIALLLQALISKGVSVEMGGFTLYNMLVVLYYLAFLIPLASLFFGVASIADEVEGGTIGYLFGRPVPRSLLYLVKLAATTAILGLGICLSMFVSFLLTRASASGGLGRGLGMLGMDLVTAVLGVAVYTALFSFIGLAFKKPLFWGFLVAFGWENLVAWLPGFLKRFTVLFHLHTLCPQPTNPTGLVANMLAASESKTAAFAFLFFYLILFSVLACWKIRRMEVSAGKEE